MMFCLCVLQASWYDIMQLRITPYLCLLIKKNYNNTEVTPKNTSTNLRSLRLLWIYNDVSVNMFRFL